MEPDRHALVVPDCECGTCPPTWARRRGKSRRFTEPVTLVAALAKEDAAARPGMVERHRQGLEERRLPDDHGLGLVGLGPVEFVGLGGGQVNGRIGAVEELAPKNDHGVHPRPAQSTMPA